MTWIKRNLFFLIGGVIALALLAGAAFYLLQNYKLRTEKKEKLTAEYGELERLTQMNPGPGDGKKVDNIKAARDYQKDLQAFTERSGKFFTRIPRIPESVDGKSPINDHDFASALRDTIGMLTRSAQNSSVLLPPGYDFSFRAIKSKITFAPGSLEPLSVQLGEVKTICQILFQAKINSLDGLRRERVSPDDREMADYLEEHSITNETAILTPYEVSFHCFSGELAGVLTGFAASPYAITVKRIAVEPAGALPMQAGDAMAAPVQPVYAPAPPPAMRGEDEEGRSRYPAPAVPVPVAGSAPVAGRGPLPTVLNEQPLRVTLRLEVIKRAEATQ